MSANKNAAGKTGKKNRIAKKLLCSTMVVLLLLSLMPVGVQAAESVKGDDAIIWEYGDYEFTKISNPTAGSGEPDGINTNDETGFDANRLNSYAWAVASRGDYIYIGTNRTLFGSALNAVGETLHNQNENITPEKLGNAVTALTGGDVPVNLEEEDYIPQIIKFDLKNGSTKVIYQPQTKRGEDGVLYYTDRDGNIISAADVCSETASFRSVIEFKGNLYYGSLGVNMLQLVRVDEEDNAEVVFQTIGLTSSLRACCKFGEGAEETIYFGGQDTTYLPWRIWRMNHPGDNVLPIVIRSLDPETAGSEQEDWDGIIADFRDFGKYARAQVYVSGGGNVWDLCSYNGKMYLILAYDRGWALFRGEKAEGDPDANEFGWKWTEIVGDDSIYGYPLAMDEEVGVNNEYYREAYSCNEFAPNLRGAGLLESTATPYVYDGKLYLGSFDNATSIQSETVVKLITKLGAMMNSESESNGPSLEQIYAPIYEVLSHPQHIWVMDEDENISAVNNANSLLADTTNDYVWRFVEHDGKLYTGTFDSATAYKYFVDVSMETVISLLASFGQGGEDGGDGGNSKLDALQSGAFREELLAKLDAVKTRDAKQSNAASALRSAADTACRTLQAFLHDEASVEELLPAMRSLENARNAYSAALRDGEDDPTDPEDPEDPGDGMPLIDWLLSMFDVEGLEYWAKARALVQNAESGFDIFVTEDGKHWDVLVRNGLEDPYNYGARTFTVCNNELYVGTANPYYGAQLWKVKDNSLYEIHIAETQNGSASADLRYASAGTTVTVTAQPDERFEVHTVTVTDVSGAALSVTENEDGTYSFTMPGCDVTVKVLFHEVDCPSAQFTDVNTNAWYHEAVDFAILNGLMQGVSETSFDPNGKLTRAMLVTMLYSMAGRPAVEAENPFDDVSAGSWYADPVIWASSNGIVSGYGNGKFGPKDNLTREQFAVILYNYAAMIGRDTSAAADLSAYQDADQISGWALTALQWAHAEGLINGYSSTRLAPKGTATRAEAAVIFMRFLENE